jgi:hypothetical protein
MEFKEIGYTRKGGSSGSHEVNGLKSGFRTRICGALQRRTGCGSWFEHCWMN